MIDRIAPGEVLHCYVSAFFDELSLAGVRHVCACPGSRSTPLAMIAAERNDLKLWMHLDERSAAFFALGIAKQTGDPVAAICTSGTAAANFMPAVVEARYGRVPLVILTADRPPELQDVGAPQTIDQQHMYGRHAKWFTSMMLPEASSEALRYARTIAARAVSTAGSTPYGPVHVNMPFREPLVPVIPGRKTLELLSRREQTSGRPDLAVSTSSRAPDTSTIRRLAADLVDVDRGLIICGPIDNEGYADEVAALAAVLNFPILADPLSGIRSGIHDRTNIIDAYDALLRDPMFTERFAPRVVLRFGAMPTSKPVLQYLQHYPACRQIVVDGGGGWNDPTGLAQDFILADEPAFCIALTDAVMNIETRNLDANPRIGWSSKPSTDNADESAADWARLWREANRIARQSIDTTVSAFTESFEGRSIATLCDLLPQGATLVVGSSMPVRDLDTFVGSSDLAIRFLANRGANGIDGVVSTALGVAATASGSVALAIGDISFYHDLNGLLAAKQYPIDLTVLLLNNDGGGIFSFLPQAAHPAHFERLFGTPHGLSFGPSVEMFGGRFHQANGPSELESMLVNALVTPGLDVIEVRTERLRNVELHRQVWPAVAAALREAGITENASQAMLS